jgi:hypothetical protein
MHPVPTRAELVGWLLTVGIAAGLVILMLTSFNAYLILFFALVALTVVVGLASQTDSLVVSPFSNPDRQRPSRGLRSWFERGSEPWFEFADLPGEHLRWVRGGSKTLSLVDAEDHQLARVELKHGWPRRLQVGGRSYRAGIQRESFRELCDEQTGRVALTLSGRHFDHHSDAQAWLAGGPRFSFPVTGQRIGRAVMQGIDRDGNQVMYFRRVPSSRRLFSRPTIQVVVAPSPISEELILVVAAASPLLKEYFRLPLDTNAPVA